jgi:hypothetical protein
MPGLRIYLKKYKAGSGPARYATVKKKATRMAFSEKLTFKLSVSIFKRDQLSFDTQTEYYLAS